MNPKDHLTLYLAMVWDLRIQKPTRQKRAYGTKNVKQRHKSKQGRKAARRNR